MSSSGFSGDGGAATSALLSSPRGLTVAWLVDCGGSSGMHCGTFAPKSEAFLTLTTKVLPLQPLLCTHTWCLAQRPSTIPAIKIQPLRALLS